MKVCRWGFFLRWQVVLDAYTYLFHGEVFASMQSGNVILLGSIFQRGSLNKPFDICRQSSCFSGDRSDELSAASFSDRGWIVWQNAALIFEAIGILVLLLLDHSPMS